jgi:hypothetical protein
MQVTAVELTYVKDKLTLKHDRENKLEIKVTGNNFTVDEYRIEIARVRRWVKSLKRRRWILGRRWSRGSSSCAVSSRRAAAAGEP